MPKQRLQRDNIAAALAKKPICEAVSELMKRERTDAGAPADTPDHPHQCLPAGRPLRIEAPTLALERRNPLLDLNDEDVGVVLRGAPAYERERARQAACLTELLRLDDA